MTGEGPSPVIEEEVVSKKSMFSDDTGELFATYIIEDSPRIVTDEMWKEMTVAEQDAVLRDRWVNPKNNLPFQNACVGFGDTLYRLAIVTESDVQEEDEALEKMEEDEHMSPYWTRTEPVVRYRRVYINQHQTTNVSNVSIHEDEHGKLHVNIALDRHRDGEDGDKYSDRHGNKGVLSHKIPFEELPWRDDGICVEAISNSHSFPTRRVSGRLQELTRSTMSVQTPDYVLKTDGLGINFVTPFSSKSVEKKESEDDIDASTMEVMSKMGTAVVGWKKYELAKLDAQSIVQTLFLSPLKSVL